MERKRIKVGPTPLAQWHSLVQDAEKAVGFRLEEELENYLVLLLEHFTSKPEVAKSILSLEYLESHNKLGSQKQIELREVGDKCLLFSGLFPELAINRRVSVTYFVDIGQQAYYSLATLPHSSLNELFHSLGLKFVSLMDTLQCMRELAGQEFGISPLQAEELWRNTGSQHALQVLRRCTKENGIFNSNFSHTFN